MKSRLLFYFTAHKNVHAEKRSESLPSGNTAPLWTWAACTASEKLRHDDPTAQIHILAPVTLRGKSSLSESLSSSVSYTEPGSPYKHILQCTEDKCPRFQQKITLDLKVSHQSFSSQSFPNSSTMRRYAEKKTVLSATALLLFQHSIICLRHLKPVNSLATILLLMHLWECIFPNWFKTTTIHS